MVEIYHNMLKNAKMFGGDPMSTVRLGSVSGNGTTDAYGFAGFDGYDGIITIRNAAQSAKTAYPEDIWTFLKIRFFKHIKIGNLQSNLANSQF